MTWIIAIFLGAIQGLSEFLPVSSSGHLVLAQKLFGIKQVEPILFELIVHVATLFSVVIFFRQSILQLLKGLWLKNRKAWVTLLLLIIATIPAGIVGVACKDFFSHIYDSPRVVCLCLIITGIILWLTRWLPSVPEAKSPVDEPTLSFRCAVIMGVMQSLAIFPGISRSGTTIVAGLLQGYSRRQIAEFSFFMSIPIILGGFIFALKDKIVLCQQQAEISSFAAVKQTLIECFSAYYGVAFVTAFMTGLLAIFVVMKLLINNKFSYFSYYCLFVGVSGLFYFTFRFSL